mmetsp:Transcript_20211/g.46639  ORF Transcript_20211/g.46639 Transcript_20211/m.46639 type:complete len:248 (+) Transcript_20211:2021-2764(+)
MRRSQHASMRRASTIERRTATFAAPSLCRPPRRCCRSRCIVCSPRAVSCAARAHPTARNSSAARAATAPSIAVRNARAPTGRSTRSCAARAPSSCERAVVAMAASPVLPSSSTWRMCRWPCRAWHGPTFPCRARRRAHVCLSKAKRRRISMAAKSLLSRCRRAMRHCLARKPPCPATCTTRRARSLASSSATPPASPRSYVSFKATGHTSGDEAQRATSSLVAKAQAFASSLTGSSRSPRGRTQACG